MPCYNCLVYGLPCSYHSLSEKQQRAKRWSMGNIYHQLRLLRTLERPPPCGKDGVLPSQEELRLMVLKTRWSFLAARINKQKQEFRQLRVQLSPQERQIFPGEQLMTVSSRKSFLMLKAAELLESKSLERRLLKKADSIRINSETFLSLITDSNAHLPPSEGVVYTLT